MKRSRPISLWSTPCLLASMFLFLGDLRPINAQTVPTGSMIGVVIDSQGAVVPGARVVLLQANRIAVRETTSSGRGEFAFLNVLAGSYTVSVEKDGLTQPGGAQPAQIEPGRVLQGGIVLTVAAVEDALIISASRNEARLSETAPRSFVATAGDLQRAQRVSLLEVLRSSPGATVMQTARRGGVTSLFVRGGESDYTKVLIDGVPANDAGGAFDLADLTTDNLARVELVRGAQGALYGSDAMTGLLQIFTHRGTTPDPTFELTAEGGSFGFNRQATRLSGLRRALDYSLGFTHLRTNGRDRNDDYQNRIASANLGYQFNPQTQGRLTVRNENSGAGVPGPTTFLFVDPDERIERRRIAVSSRFDNQTTSVWRQSVSYVYSANHQLSFDPTAQDLRDPATPRDLGTAFNDFPGLFSNHQRRLGIRYQSDVVLDNGHFVSSGLDYEEESAVFDSGFEGRNRVASKRRSTGMYVQDQFAYRTRLYFTTGLRLEQNRATLPESFPGILAGLGSTPYQGTIGFGTQLVPRASLTWVVRQSGLQSRRGPTRLRLHYGEGIKAPTLVEAFSPNGFFLGNPGLRPERARSFDAGLEQLLWKDRYRIELNYFDNRFRDQIAYIANPATFGGPITLPDGRLTHYLNNDRARAHGYELLISARPLTRLRINTHYTRLDTRLVTGAETIDYSTFQLAPNPEVGFPLLRRPRHSGAVQATWLGKRFDLHLDGFLIGSRRDLDPVTFARFTAPGRPLTNPGYSRFDLSGSVRLNRQMTFFSRIENLLNRSYQEVYGFPAYRMTFSTGLRIRLGRE
jgi:vitamin B12 transporter